MNISELRKALFSFAKSTDACEDALDDIIAIDSIRDFQEFLRNYSYHIDQRVDFKWYDIVHKLTPEKIFQYFESPFVSDFDKNRVKEFLNK